MLLRTTSPGVARCQAATEYMPIEDGHSMIDDNIEPIGATCTVMFAGKPEQEWALYRVLLVRGYPRNGLPPSPTSEVFLGFGTRHVEEDDGQTGRSLRLDVPGHVALRRSRLCLTIPIDDGDGHSLASQLPYAGAIAFRGHPWNGPLLPSVRRLTHALPAEPGGAPKH